MLLKHTRYIFYTALQLSSTTVLPVISKLITVALRQIVFIITSVMQIIKSDAIFAALLS